MIHFDEAGSGPAVVLIHGAPSPASDFGPVVARLSARHRVLVPHLPGYGASPALQPYRLEELHDLFERGMRERGVGACAVIGFSFGAYHAFALAVRSRIQVTRVASIGGFAGMTPEEAGAVSAFAPFLRALPDARDPALRQMFVSRMLSPHFHASHPDVRERVAAWLELTPLSVLADEMEAAAGAPNLEPALAKLEVPVLVRVGELDVAAPPHMSRRIAGAAPAATLQIVRGAGHALLLEDAEATAAAIERWLDASSGL